MLDFIRIACGVPTVCVGDVKKNTAAICKQIAEADGKNVDLVVFPELGLTGYSCGDLFFQEVLLQSALTGLREIADCSAKHPNLTAVVGLPAMIAGQLYNCAAVLRAGEVLGLVPKTYLPNYGGFYERRWFSSSEDLLQEQIPLAELGLSGDGMLPVGRNLLFPVGGGAMLGVEICEDLWAPIPPSTYMALSGAEVIVNLAASNETVGKRARRREKVRQQSAAGTCVYAFASAADTESTQDMVFSGHSVIASGGNILAENQKLLDGDYLLVCDADLGKIRAERRQNKTVRDAASLCRGAEPARIIGCFGGSLRSDGSLYQPKKNPFLSDDPKTRAEECRSVFEMQVAGLKRRLSLLGANAVIGVSGGLDSTLALLVAVEAMKQLGRPASDVYGVTMPCFGTSDRTYQNALRLMETLGITCKEINIREAVTQHFVDIAHDINVHNGTYENAQARERTQILMDYAGTVNGIVVGTGDLSELALGWCTYNGDQMSMYGVNASVPKTMISEIIAEVAGTETFAVAAEILRDILDTPISPELLPPDKQGNILQQTEDIIGPYALHDFFLYYVLRYGFAPKKIYALACRAFAGEYDKQAVKKYLQLFYRRFFTQQFKRNAMPDGASAGPVSLNPRGDWRMPSDASGDMWLAEIETL